MVDVAKDLQQLVAFYVAIIKTAMLKCIPVVDTSVYFPHLSVCV